jgi:hypothetical protein
MSSDIFLIVPEKTIFVIYLSVVMQSIVWLKINVDRNSDAGIIENVVLKFMMTGSACSVI